MTALAARSLDPYADAPDDTDLDEFDPAEHERREEIDGEEQESDEPQVLRIEEIAAGGVDLAHILPDDVLNRIAGECREGYDRDKADRAEWEKAYDETEKMVKGEREEKSFPWPGAANVKYPLIMTASLQFGARTYPAIVRGRDVVIATVNGDDPDGAKRARGNRVADHMNWQLIEDMPEWEEDTDRLVHMLPWMGCLFRQVLWDATYTRPKTSLVSARALVVSQAAKDLETVPLFTKEFELFPHEIIERQRDGRYVEADIKWTTDDRSKPEDMLECHCRYDLDEDGYDEPWIAVIHKDSGKLLSLKAGFWPAGVEREPGRPVLDMMTGQMAEGPPGRVLRVRRHVEFIKYGFVPDFSGGFLDIGFGQLLSEHNHIINTLLSQLIDAATDQNAGGGFIGKGVGLKGGRIDFEPGEYKYIAVSGGTLRDNIVPRPTSQPSPVLFQLLGLMIEAGKEVASIRDVLTGEGTANQPATTTLALIEQGLQVFNSIYKRIFRSLGKELSLIYQLNGAYLPDEAYFQVMDSQKAVAREDYRAGDYDIRPMADPSATTSQQRLAKAQFLDGFKGNPLVDQREIIIRQMAAAGVEDVETLVPKPDPKAQEMQAQQLQMTIRKVMAEIMGLEADAFETMAAAKLKQAQAAETIQNAKVKPLEVAMDMADRIHGAGQEMMNGADVGGVMGGMAGMVGAPVEPPVSAPPVSPFDGLRGNMEGPPVGQPGGPVNGGIPGPASPIPGL